VLRELERPSGDTKDKASDAELLVVTYEMRAQYTYELDRGSRAVIEPFINPQEIPPLRFAALHSFGMTLAIGLSTYDFGLILNLPVPTPRYAMGRSLHSC
jgi:hypothetical protein